jgi:hypothetical protein
MLGGVYPDFRTIVFFYNGALLMETLDWKKLALDVNPDTKKVLYEPNKQHFTKIAFDVFQLNTSPVQSLWTLEEDDDGTSYLVAQYEDIEERPLESKSHWIALSDRDNKNVTLFYKDMAIQRFASSEFGFGNDDVHIFQRTLVEKLSSDRSFVEKLLKSQSEDTREALLSRFPELV